MAEPGPTPLFMSGTDNNVIVYRNDVLQGTGGDTITGFIPGVDRITLEIPGLAPGMLGSLVNDLGTNTFAGSATGGATPQVIISHWNGSSYDSNTYLWVDYNGSNPGEGYLVANLGSTTPLYSSDIYII